MIAQFFILPVIVPILGIIAATLTIVATSMQWITPFVVGAGNFIVWYFKQFLKGLGVIITNLSTLSVLAALIISVGVYIRSSERADCREEVQKQRDYDSYKYKRQPEGTLPSLSDDEDAPKIIKVPNYHKYTPKPSKTIKPKIKSNPDNARMYTPKEPTTMEDYFKRIQNQ